MRNNLKFTRRRFYLVIGAVTACFLIVGLVGYGYQLQTDHTNFTSPRIAVVTDALSTDNGWGAASSSAARLINDKYGFEVAFEDNVAIADIDQTLKKYAESHYDLIIAHGFQWGDASLRIGSQYPNTKIVVFTGLVESENVASIFPMQQEGSFLLGALAGMMTKTNVIGYVGGEEYPNLINIFEGYKQGAKAVNQDVRIIGTYVNNWDNPEKGKESAMFIIRQNADIIFHVADSSGLGVIQAAKESNVYALGAVQDQNFLAPETVLSSFVVDVDKAYDQIVQMFMEKKFQGKIFKPGIEREKNASGDGVVYITPFHSLENRVPNTVKARLSQLTEDIVTNQLIIPERLEEE
jgi:basic membrane protein A